MIDSEAPLHVCKATEPPAVKIREINLRCCRRESNPRRRHDERASNPLGHRGSSYGCGWLGCIPSIPNDGSPLPNTPAGSEILWYQDTFFIIPQSHEFYQ